MSSNHCSKQKNSIRPSYLKKKCSLQNDFQIVSLIHKNTQISVISLPFKNKYYSHIKCRPLLFHLDHLGMRIHAILPLRLMSTRCKLCSGGSHSLSMEQSVTLCWGCRPRLQCFRCTTYVQYFQLLRCFITRWYKHQYIDSNQLAFSQLKSEALGHQVQKMLARHPEKKNVSGGHRALGYICFLVKVRNKVSSVVKVKITF